MGLDRSSENDQSKSQLATLMQKGQRGSGLSEDPKYELYNKKRNLGTSYTVKISQSHQRRLDREKIYRGKIIDELIETEKSYVETLTIIVDIFLKPLFDESKIKFDRKSPFNLSTHP